MCVKKLLIIVFFAALGLSLCSCAAKPAASVRVRVLDGFTESPIEGAAVTVPEAGETCITGADGFAPPIPVPVIPDAAYESLRPSGSGRVTLIVTAPGYTPCLLLYARVVPNEVRTAELLLFPDDGSLPVFTMVEAPNDEWCRALVKKYGSRFDRGLSYP